MHKKMKTIYKLIGLCIMICYIMSCNSNTANNTSDDTIDSTSQEIVEHGHKEKPDTVVSAQFKDETGKLVHTSELNGKVVFINFWATWCPPCRKEMPSIQLLYNKFKSNENIVFLIVEIEHDVEGTKKFLTEGDLSLPIYYPEGEIPGDWLGGAIPTTVILDKTGKIAAKQEGMYDFSTEAVESFIQNLINQ